MSFGSFDRLPNRPRPLRIATKSTQLVAILTFGKREECLLWKPDTAYSSLEQSRKTQ